jgi:hypothetical protein
VASTQGAKVTPKGDLQLASFGGEEISMLGTLSRDEDQFDPKEYKFSFEDVCFFFFPFLCKIPKEKREKTQSILLLSFLLLFNRSETRRARKPWPMSPLISPLMPA